MALLGDLINNQLLAAMFYRNTSAVSHAALHGLTKRLELRQDGDDAYRARLRTVSVAEATAEIAAALVALAIVARAVLTQAGWASRQFDVADAAFQSIIQTLIA
jgi:hypothetical protein